MQTIENLLFSTNTPIKLKSVPTSSSHSKLIKQLLNELITQYPEYQNLLLTLACYPIQKWASIQRGEALKTKKLYFNLINASEIGLVNIVTDDLTLTNQIVDFLDNILNLQDNDICLDVIRSAHGLYSPDVSTFRFQTHYKETLLKLCKKYNSAFNKLIENESKYLAIDEDIELVYHNINILMKSRSILLKISNSKNIKTKYIDSKQMLQSIQTLINTLDTYYLEPDLTKQIVSMKFNGSTENEIAEKVKKSRVFVRNRYTEGITALSYVLWGYSTRDILMRLI